MSTILFATVPMSGHINPVLPIASELINRKHRVVWYAGSKFKDRIEDIGAEFYPMDPSVDFDEQNIDRKFPGLPRLSQYKQAKHYIKYVFYDAMLTQYNDLRKIIKETEPDIYVTDDKFTGIIPVVENSNKPWVVYNNTPLMHLSQDAPTPGSGLLPDYSNYGKKSNAIVNWLLVNVFFKGVHNYANKIRKEAGLPLLKNFVLEYPIYKSSLFLQFSTDSFEFKRNDLPANLKYVGPALPIAYNNNHFDWLSKVKSADKVVMVTQGTLDVHDINKLIIPTIKALANSDVMVLVSAGGSNINELRGKYNFDNIIIEEYIPYTEIMPYVNILISNGGYGGIHIALAFGVPIIICAETEEKPETGLRLEFSGAGINIKKGKSDPQIIREKVDCILNSDTYKENAERIRKDFLEHNAVAESIKYIEKLLIN